MLTPGAGMSYVIKKLPGGGSQPSVVKTCEGMSRELVKRQGKSHVACHPRRRVRGPTMVRPVATS